MGVPRESNNNKLRVENFNSVPSFSHAPRLLGAICASSGNETNTCGHAIDPSEPAPHVEYGYICHRVGVTRLSISPPQNSMHYGLEDTGAES